jgi:hypothetical protein
MGSLYSCLPWGQYLVNRRAELHSWTLLTATDGEANTQHREVFAHDMRHRKGVSGWHFVGLELKANLLWCSLGGPKYQDSQY